MHKTGLNKHDLEALFSLFKQLLAIIYINKITGSRYIFTYIFLYIFAKTCIIFKKRTISEINITTFKRVQFLLLWEGQVGSSAILTSFKFAFSHPNECNTIIPAHHRPLLGVIRFGAMHSSNYLSPFSSSQQRTSLRLSRCHFSLSTPVENTTTK